MVNIFEMISTAVAKGNMSKKQDLMCKNAQYLERFKTNNREKEYQAYVSSGVESEKEVPC